MVVYSEGRNVRPVPLYKQRKQGQFVPPCCLLLLLLHKLRRSPLLLEAERAALRPSIATSITMPSTFSTTSAMAPKADKGKGVKSAEAQRLAALLPTRNLVATRCSTLKLLSGLETK